MTTTPTDTTQTVELEGAQVQWLDAYRAAKQQLDDAQAAVDRCREQLERFLGDAETATVDGKPVITWRWSRPTARVDVKALREEEPDIADAFTVLGNPVRSFRLVEQ